MASTEQAVVDGALQWNISVGGRVFTVNFVHFLGFWDSPPGTLESHMIVSLKKTKGSGAGALP